MVLQTKKWKAVTTSWLLVACGWGAAQQPKESPSFQLQMNVDRLLVPVVVRDAHGNTIDDLKQEDFQVFDNGKPRPISGFTIRQRGAAVPAPAPPPATTETAQQPGPPDRITVFLFDDMHLTAEDLAHARTAGMTAINGGLTGTDLAAG